VSASLYGKCHITPNLTRADARYLEKLMDERHDEPGAPSIWCPLQLGEETTEGTEIVPKGDEKPRGEDGWLSVFCKYLKAHGYLVNGVIYGRDYEDNWKTTVRDSVVKFEVMQREW
jgi:hypothetical protein